MNMKIKHYIYIAAYATLTVIAPFLHQKSQAFFLNSVKSQCKVGKYQKHRLNCVAFVAKREYCCILTQSWYTQLHVNEEYKTNGAFLHATWKQCILPSQKGKRAGMPWPGFEPGLSRPQREVLTTIRSRPEIPLFWRQFLSISMMQATTWTKRTSGVPLQHSF